MATEGTVDSGPLLETCASAGATLVAIVGGLLVARYVGLEADRQGAANRLADAEMRREEAEAGDRAAAEQLDVFEIEGEIDRPGIRLLFLRKAGQGDQVTADEIRQQADVDRFPADAVTRVVAEWNHEAPRVLAATDLWEDVDSTVERPWFEFKRGRGLQTNIDELWEEYYNARWHGRVVVDPTTNRTEFDDFSDLYPGEEPILGSRVSSAAWRDTRVRLIARRDEAAANSAAAQAELLLAQQNLLRLGRPPGLVLGLVVLGFLTVLSVVVPVLYLAPEPAELSYRGAAWIVTLFFVGIVCLFGYMALHVYRLRSTTWFSNRARAKRAKSDSAPPA